MPRSPRLGRPHGLAHVVVRGTARCTIFLDDHDRRRFLKRLDEVGERVGWTFTGYCLMTNHAHLLLDAEAGVLSRGMQLVMGSYARFFNVRHDRPGHLVQGRFHAEPIRRHAHLLEVARYVVLNPVRAGICPHPGDYGWSSYRATAFGEGAPASLDVRPVLRLFDEDAAVARRRYRVFVEDAA